MTTIKVIKQGLCVNKAIRNVGEILEVDESELNVLNMHADGLFEIVVGGDKPAPKSSENKSGE